MAPVEELIEEGALDARGEDVHVAEGERGGGDLGGRDRGAFEKPRYV